MIIRSKTIKPSKENLTPQIIKFVIMFTVFLFLIGCTLYSNSETETKDRNIITIENVLSTQFTGPDQKLIELMNSKENWTIIGDHNKSSDQESNSKTDLDLYLEQKYKDYFTEEMYSKFIRTYALDYQASAFYGGYKIETENIDIKHNDTTEGAYDFLVKVRCIDKENEQSIANVSGRAYFYNTSKISSIRFFDDEHLLEVLKAGS
jgi:hypothetical protein